MAINWGLMDAQYPARLADLFNPSSIQARNAEIEAHNSANLMRQAQALQAAQQIRRAPELARREDMQWQEQQQERARKVQEQQQAAQEREAIIAQLDPKQQQLMRLGVSPDKFMLPEQPKLPSIVQEMRAAGISETSPEGQRMLRQRLVKETTHAPAANTYLNMPLEKEEGKAKGKLNVDYYKDLQTDAGVARKLNAQLDVQTGLLNKGFQTGWGTESIAQGANFLTTMGIAPEVAKEYASDAQKFRAAANEVVLQKQLAQKGPQTESDAKRIAETGANLGNTPQANRFILDVARAQNNKSIAQQKFFDSYWRTNGTYEGAEERWFAGEGGKSIFADPVLSKYKTNATQPKSGSKGATFLGFE